MPRVLDEILNEIKNLEPLPRIAMRVIEVSSRPEVVPSEIVALIQSDGALTAKVLKLCNSAYYGFQREIGSLSEAGNLLGVSVLANLVLTSCTSRFFRDGGTDAALQARRWEESISNALAAQLLARVHGGSDASRAYTAGLLLNIGELLLDRFCAREELQVRAAVAAGESQVAAERALFGMDHAEVGARLCEKWCFPPALVDAIRFHHEPENAAVDPLLACFVHVAELATARLLDGRDEPAPALSGLACTRTGLQPDLADSIEARLAVEVERARTLVELF